ncbi:SIS domain-containing protein [Nonomuraea sp. MTCD27]|uniref:SIS domain-containing protein n=1 Tax=Nonomuraea sp. MTCD27 TaxID=1676747 RepID=UPI0035C25D2A
MRFALEDQIAAQPDMVANALTADPPRLDGGRPIIFTGIGTSLHAARIAAAWAWHVSGGRSRAVAVDAHDLALRFPITAEDQVVVISHRGYKRYPRAVLGKARAAGATTIAVVGTDAPDQQADVVARTCPDETAGTFTVSYLSSLAVLGGMVAGLEGPYRERFAAALRTVPQALKATLAEPAPVRAAEGCAAGEPLLLVGFDLDAITAAEAALKIKEGARLWAEAMSTEFSLHGTPAAFRAGMNVISITPGTDDQGRTNTLRALLAELGATVWTSGEDDEELRFAPVDPLMRPFTSIVPLQRLTAELARLRGTDPDTLHGGVEPWLSAMTGLEL